MPLILEAMEQLSLTRASFDLIAPHIQAALTAFNHSTGATRVRSPPLSN